MSKKITKRFKRWQEKVMAEAEADNYARLISELGPGTTRAAAEKDLDDRVLLIRTQCGEYGLGKAKSAAEGFLALNTYLGPVADAPFVVSIFDGRCAMRSFGITHPNEVGWEAVIVMLTPGRLDAEFSGPGLTKKKAKSIAKCIRGEIEGDGDEPTDWSSSFKNGLLSVSFHLFG